MSTFGHAIRLGAGEILTDGVNRFMISDWSIGTGDVYGWRMRKDGTRGAYCKLPADLRKEDEKCQ